MFIRYPISKGNKIKLGWVQGKGGEKKQNKKKKKKPPVGWGPSFNPSFNNFYV
jgi:hypothetical protein